MKDILSQNSREGRYSKKCSMVVVQRQSATRRDHGGRRRVSSLARSHATFFSIAPFFSTTMTSTASSYDVLIVGAGVAGCAFAHALSTITSPSHTKPLRIALLERSLAKPDRIVGELLQPGGVMALRKLGMEDCLEDIGAVPVRGYCVVHDGKQVHIPYPGGHEGRSFHHGRFIMALREKAKKAENVDVIEATVNSLVNDEGSGRIVGVKATRKGGDTSTKETFLARLVIIADGCFSNFRSQVMGETAEKPSVRGYFIGSILKDVNLPIDKHGTVCLVKGSGPVLLYQIEEHDTRILIDVKDPLPSDLKVRTPSLVRNEITPYFP